MLRRLADSVYQHLLKKFPSGQSYGRPDFSADGMPASIAHYLTCALDARLEPELVRVQQAASEWFDSEHPDVGESFRSLTEVLVRHAHFPADEWAPALERAVRNVLSYHARPARTLLDFLFIREEDRHTPDGLMRKLAYFADYPHLEPVIREYVREHDPEDLGRDALSAFVDHVDEQMRVQEDLESWTTLLRPLYEITNVLPEYQDVVPVELLIAFFRDKGVAAVERRLERLHEMDGVDVMSLDEVRRVVQEAESPAPRPVSPKVRHERVVQPDAAGHRADEAEQHPEAEEQTVDVRAPQQETPAQRPERAEPERPSPAGPVPLWQRFQQSTPPPPPAPRAQVQASPAPTPRRPDASAPSPPGEARPLWMRFSDQRPEAAPRQQPGPIQERPPHVAQSLGELEQLVLGGAELREREDYIKVLFRGSRGAYHEALEHLVEMRTWTDASRFIANEIFRLHQVNIYSDTAVAFTNAVEARFQIS